LTEARMPGPLAGIRVVELSTFITAPLAGVMLADLGAEVVKVENPDGGDPFRSYGGGNYGAQYCSYNRNKRSIAIQLRTDAGRAAFEALVRRSDVLLDNFRHGVLDRLGYPSARLRELNPRLIHCSITGFGSQGPYATRPCFDSIAQGLSGMYSQFIDPENPRLTGTTIADNVTGQYAAYGILSALFERERTGVARRVEVNMLEATMAFMPEPFGYLTQNGEHSDAFLRIRNSLAFAFRCRDGKLVVTHMSSRQKFFEEFAALIGRPELVDDARFRTLEGRVANYELLRGIAAESFLKDDRAEWLRRFESADIPISSINGIEEAMADPQVRALDSFCRLVHPERGELVGIRRPVRFDGRRDDQPAVAPPVLGEHTAEILRELGLAPPGDSKGAS
jgi:crotonobetainyl-CoA:carnitine CoA-transferase CaiB-like acyl-CoA transferase